MAPVHFPLLIDVLRSLGYDVRLLAGVSDHAVSLGLRYVNNDACYPAIVTIGQLLEATEAPGFDPDKSALLFAQTCGPCRATNYPTLLDWALADKGIRNLPVVTLSGRSLAGHAHLRLGIAGLKKLSMAVVLGDVQQRLYLHAKTAEVVPGSADMALRLASSDAGRAACSGKMEAFVGAVHKTLEIFSSVECDGKVRPKWASWAKSCFSTTPKRTLKPKSACAKRAPSRCCPTWRRFSCTALQTPSGRAVTPKAPNSEPW